MRYAVGIDLGTTNCALAWLDLDARVRRVQVMELAQLVAPGDVGRRRTLPSFLYIPGEHELPAGATALPWDRAARDVVGELARTQGAQVAGRLISSAKSWLCHPAVDRQAAILPWAASPDVPRRSPVDASAAYLAHMARAFEAETGVPLASTDLVVTVPASFDEVARELTVEAARRAGLGKLHLLEEPQAAFYSFIEAHREEVPLQGGETILVCDIGGGTTDFSLIRCEKDEAARFGLRFERTAVGDHLLLGGDNMDLALARRVERRAAARDKIEKLDAQRFQSLAQACRVAKEKLLGDAPRDRWTIHLAGRGRSLIGGSISLDLERAEVEETILEGFFPLVPKDAEPQRGQGLGLREFGLPYASDPAVTRHLAAFLRQHACRPDAILFNGGVLEAARIRDRIVDVVAGWAGRRPLVLDNEALDLAVARGAAYFAIARRGEGLRIGGGAARAYYVEIDAPGEAGETRVQAGTVTALCLAARGESDTGERVELPRAGDRAFEVLTNRPVRFKLLHAADRADKVGDLLTLPRGALAELPPIVTVLRFPRSSQDVSLKVTLHVERTEIGTLDIHLLGENGERYKLAFDLRAAEQAPAAEPAASSHDEKDAEIDPAKIAAAEEVIRRVFDKAHAEPIGPAQAMKELTFALGLDRGAWPTTVLRALWEPLKALRGQRGRTAEHEARWLNLVGWCLRPGYGYALDDWRVKEAWRFWNAGLVNEKDPRCHLEWWILWRRVSGGLTRTMQDELWKRLFPYFAPDAKRRADRKPPSAQEFAEMLRVAGSLERIPQAEKWKLGEILLGQVERDAKKGAPSEPAVWALGRLGGRVPLYGPVENVISAKRAERWLDRLLALDWQTDSARLGHNALAFAAAEIARASGDRARDLDEPARQRVAARIAATEGGARLSKWVLEPVQLEAGEERFAFGDALPAGLRLSSTVGRGEEEAAKD